MTSAVIAWSVWLAMAVAAVLLIRNNTRNIPYMDDFSLVPMMTGNARVDFNWAWAQHNEHRPFLSRLILAGAYRYISNDFRTGMYINVSVMSTAAASMLLLARRVRGRSSVMDSALPIAILSLGQAETFLIGFALNLVMSSWIAVEMISIVDQAGRSPGWRPALRFGVCLVLLPLCGGSGLVMLPPLMLWLSGYITVGWWSGQRPGAAARGIGLLSLVACTAVVAMYMRGYYRPGHHPQAPSVMASASTTMELLSLVVMTTPEHWRPVAAFVVALMGVTLTRLFIVAIHAPCERARVSGLIALIVAMLGVAVAVGMSRSGFGPGMGLTSRYVTTVAPLFAVLYIAMLMYGGPWLRPAVNASLFILVCLALPANREVSLRLGQERFKINRQFERSLDARLPASRLMAKVCPSHYPDSDEAYRFLKMLKDARIGKFKHFVDDRIAIAPGTIPVIR